MCLLNLADSLTVKVKWRKSFAVNNSEHSAELWLLFLVQYRNNFQMQPSGIADHYTQATLKLFGWKMSPIMILLSTECVYVF